MKETILTKINAVHLRTATNMVVGHKVSEGGMNESKETKIEKQQIEELLDKFPEVFSQSETDIGCCKLIKHKIDVNGATPIRCRPYRTNPAMEEIIEKHVNILLESGIAQPSTSAWASPLLAVQKKDGSWRICVDYRKVNKLIKMDAYPIPLIAEIIDCLGKAKYFSTLDLKSGYYQMELDEGSREISAFVCKMGLFEMCRTPMGLANSVSSFVRLMEEVFRDMLYKDVVIYLDDILIFSRTLQEHIEKVERVLGRLKLVNMKLKLKRSKCDFFKEEVTFLGHTISKDGVRPDERKIEVVKNYPEPTDKHELKSWLGLINFFRKYVKGFSQIAHPLHELLRKDAKFVWTLECKKAFETLRDSLISGPILGLPDFEEEFRIYSDASGYGVGYVLQQIQEGEEVVIAYGGRSLTKAERGYAIMDLEALALVSAIKHFESYLFKHFLAFVDNTGVAHLLSQKKSKGRILRWIIYLQAFDFELVYKPGKTLGNADALSRNPAWKPMVATAKADERDAILWARLQEEDGVIKPLIDFLRTGDKGKLPRKGAISQSSAHKFEVDNEGVLWRLAKNEATDQTHRVLVVPITQIRDILVDHHDSLMAGHFGIAKTFKGINARYWWVGMFNVIKQYCDL